jgi:transcriptional regulator PpsR
MKSFKSPARWLAEIDVDTAALLIAAAADVVVIMDEAGIVRDFAFQSEALAGAFAGYEHWLGRAWRDTVTVESRPKVDEMLLGAHGGSAQTGRQVNYEAAQGADIPVMFSVLPVGQTGRVIAFGRDLRSFAALQQRVVDVQQSFERDYSKMRSIETRYRILFQMAREPVLIVDVQTQKVIEANAAARENFGDNGKLIGASLYTLVDPDSVTVLDSLFADIRATGRMGDVRVKLIGSLVEMSVSAFLFRQDHKTLFLLRLSISTEGLPAERLLSDNNAKLLKLVERVPDGFVATDHDGKILAANAAFLEMTQLASGDQAAGESLDRWLGRPGVDLGILINNLRQHGEVRLYATTLRDEVGVETDVEISGGALVNAGKPSYGFAIRGISRRSTATTVPARNFPRSLEQMTELIGRVSLKELVREATDVIERLCIEAALTLTGDNRASAAEVLGVSRQSLYVKMRRHGLQDIEAAEPNE